MSTEPAPRRRRNPFLATGLTLAAAVGLGAYLYFVESQKPPADETKDKEKVLAFDRTKVSEIALRPAQGEAVRLVRQDKAWRVAEPLAAPADTGEVEAILGTLEGLQVDDTVEGATGLAPFGLEPPSRVITLKVDGAPAPLELHVGRRTPDGGLLYAKKPGEARILTLPSYADSALTKTAFDLRDRRVLHVDREAIRRIEVSGPQTAYTLEGEGETWAFTSPLHTPAGRWSVDTLVGSLDALRFESVVAETGGDLAKWGLQPPVWTVTIGAGDTRRVLHLGQRTPEGKVYAREASSPMTVLVAPALADDLAKGMGELRMKRIHDVAAFEATTVEVTDASGARTLTRSTRVDEEGVPIYDWKRNDGRAVNTKTVQDAIFLVGGVDAEEFVDAPGDPATYGLDAPTLKATIKYDGKPAASLEIGEKDGKAFVRRSGDTALLRIDPAKAKELKEAFAKL